MGSVTTAEKTYLWHGGLAVTVTQAPGQWPSIRRRTDIDVAELEQGLALELKDLQEAAEQARV